MTVNVQQTKPCVAKGGAKRRGEMSVDVRLYVREKKIMTEKNTRRKTAFLPLSRYHFHSFFLQSKDEAW